MEFFDGWQILSEALRNRALELQHEKEAQIASKEILIVEKKNLNDSVVQMPEDSIRHVAEM